MKKIIYLFFLCSFQFSFSQEVSETEKLITLCKVWGFLKYYHPEVAKGTYNWDNQFLQILPKVKGADNKEELSQVYIDWIESLGEIKACKKCKNTFSNEYYDKNFDLSWTQNSTLFSKQLSEKFKYIEENRNQGKHHYITIENAGNVKIINEPEYKDFNYPNEEYRLLGLFKYWNIIEYFFPYKYMTDQDWDEVLTEMILKFKGAETEQEYHLAILELIVCIDDSHGFFVTEQTNNYFGYKWIPAKFKIIDNQAIITGFYNDLLAEADDLRVGDIITKVNDRDIAEIFDEKEKYISGSNKTTKRANAYYVIFNGSTDSLKIEFSRNNKVEAKTIKRYFFNEFNYETPKKETHKILNKDVGYINMGDLNIKDISDIMDSFSNTKAIIFDIRNYPKGTLYSIANYITSTKKDFYKVIYPDLNYPGRFIWGSGTQCGKNGELKYKGKIVLLVNEQSQSHAEFTIMCLQTGDNVVTIGSQTSGADGNVSIFEFVGGYKTQISGIGIYYPDKSPAQRAGVKIDIKVETTVQSILEDKDEVLERAVKYIEEGI